MTTNNKRKTGIISLLIAVLLAFGGADTVSAFPKKGKTGTAQTSSSSKKKGSTAATSKAGNSKSKGKGTKKRGVSGQSKQETSAELKKRQEETRREIKLTQEQIKANEAEVKKNLGELSKLDGEITRSRERVAAASSQVQALSGKIGELESEISTKEENITRLREEYLKSVKKIRGKKKSKSMLAFIFSSGSFNQAVRRMRYLKQFSDWKEAKSAELKESVEKLKQQRDELAQTKQMHDKALATETAARNSLQQQYTRQDAVVAQLRKNGTALKNHLANKQAEANALKNRVAAIIAEEQRRAENEQRRREAEERRAQAEREKKEKEKATQAELLAAEQKKEEPTAKGETSKPGQEKPKKQDSKNKDNSRNKDKNKEKNKDKKTSKPKNAPEEQSRPKKSDSGNVDYAEARHRKPRGEGEKAVPSTAPSAPKGGSSFESMRGSLPRPVAGAFRVTSRFGRHSLPDMPDVVFDNPGIDAEVSLGATAQAVYAGKVSGVYMLPGFETVVIVNHGNYYTVYGNISSAAVKVGDSVKQGQALGRVAVSEDDSSHGSIHFEVWRNRDKLDPMGWIR